MFCRGKAQIKRKTKVSIIHRHHTVMQLNTPVDWLSRTCRILRTSQMCWCIVTYWREWRYTHSPSYVLYCQNRSTLRTTFVKRGSVWPVRTNLKCPPETIEIATQKTCEVSFNFYSILILNSDVLFLFTVVSHLLELVINRRGTISFNSIRFKMNGSRQVYPLHF